MNLAEQHVPGSKNTYYIPDFVTTDEETYLLRKVSWQNTIFRSVHPLRIPSRTHTQILETPQPKWKQLSNRRYVAIVVVDSRFCVPENRKYICIRLQTWGATPSG
jgi:hypothetical protein